MATLPPRVLLGAAYYNEYQSSDRADLPLVTALQVGA